MDNEREYNEQEPYTSTDESLEHAIQALKMISAELHAVDIKNLEFLRQWLKIEERSMEPFRPGNTYQTQSGELVTFSRRQDEKFKGTTYETMVDEYGHYRYTNRGFDSGRLTGTNHEFTEPGNILPLYRRPKPYAVPPLTMMLPEGWKLLANTTAEQRAWPEGGPNFGHYINECYSCLRPFKGHKMMRQCAHCATVKPPQVVPTAVVANRHPDPIRRGPSFVIGHMSFNEDGRPCGFGSRLVYQAPKAPEVMTYPEIKAAIEELESELASRDAEAARSDTDAGGD